MTSPPTRCWWGGPVGRPPCSPRQPQMSSRITCEVSTTRLSVAWPAVAPPMRKNTSCTKVGSDALPSWLVSGVPSWTRLAEFFGPASTIRLDSLTPCGASTSIAAVPFCGTRVGKPTPSTTVSGRDTRIGAFRLYTPGVSSRSLPRASAASMATIEVLGVAMKNLLIGRAVPAVLPFGQDGPAVFFCSDGTNTLNAPELLGCRSGSSWVCGLVSSVVYGLALPGLPSVKLVAGAPGSPEKPWFQTPFDQPSRSVLRNMNCCWEPLVTVPPENDESAMKPPLAYCGPAQQ